MSDGGKGADHPERSFEMSETLPGAESRAQAEIAGLATIDSRALGRADTDNDERVPIRRHTTSGLGRELDRGDQLGRYIVTDLLGAGGMGEVYAAYDPELDRKLAIKVVRGDIDSDAVTVGRTRLLSEAQSLARLAHPNVVAVYDVGTVEGGDVYIAMEYVQGITFTTWLEEEERTWREVVSMLALAGRGLAAAHDAGLVHRDFKPDNILIGDDGRPRVIDFGVALPVLNTDSIRDLGNDGTLVGTPAYMAPEQFEGGTIGPATDQFAFAIVLYQALAGQLPFPGATLVELADNVSAGRAREFPKNAGVPRWLTDIVYGALATAPEHRFESMSSLLDLLEGYPRQRRRRLVIGAAVVVIASVVGGVAGIARRSDLSCRGFDEQLASVWDRGRAEELRAALGGGVFERVGPALRAYGDGWVSSKELACRATHDTGEQDEETLARRMQCFDTKLREFDAVVALLAAGAKKPEQLISELPPLERCNNLAALSNQAPPPANADPEKVEAISVALAAARALIPPARFDEAEQQINRAQELADALNWRGAKSEVLIVKGMLQNKKADYRRARDLLFAAIREAEIAGDAVDAAEAWLELVKIEVDLGRPAEGKRWAEHAEIALAEAGEDQSFKARLAFNRGRAHRALQENERALELYTEARALFEHVLGADHFRVAECKAEQGSALRAVGRFDEAETEFRAALAHFENLFGTRSPALASSLNNLALLLRDRGRYEETKKLLERAVAIKEEGFGADHPSVAISLLNLALLEQRLGNDEQVERLWQRSHRIRVKALGEEHPKVNYSLLWKAEYFANSGRDAEASALVDELEVRHRSSDEGDSIEFAKVLAMKCDLHRRRGLLPAAQKACDEANEMYDRLGVSETQAFVARLASIRLLSDRAGDNSVAIERLEALREAVAGGGANHERRSAHLDALRAVLAHRLGEPDYSKYSQRALEGYQGLGAGYRYYASALQRDLAGQP